MGIAVDASLAQVWNRDVLSPASEAAYRKLARPVVVPSVAVNVIKEYPIPIGSIVSVYWPFAPCTSVSLESGTTRALLLVAVTIKFTPGVSRSLTVKVTFGFVGSPIAPAIGC